MGETTSLNWRILVAALLSIVLIVGAYLLAKGIESPPLAQASAEAALLQAIATRDSNNDGLPDWQNVLYGIPLDSATTDYFNLGMTNGEAVARGLIVPKAIADMQVATSSGEPVIVDPSLPPVPAEGTLTEAFARSFFTLYLSAKQANGDTELSTDQVETLAGQALLSLSSLIGAAPDYKSANELIVQGSSADALKAFAASAEAVVVKNKKTSDATKNEIFYLQDAVERNDSNALSHLASLAKMYRETAVGLAALPVPSELAASGLALINALMRASGIASDFARVNTDPLAAMLALGQYAQLDQSLVQTFAAISSVYAAAGIALLEGTPGALFLDTVARYRAAAASGN
ncbi:hypothetical protein HY415_00020 [Candidatus Kaiserbacteria bacterium]|nr:hypothetical protein [Candidatus Kaiserbacteria bacterium]